MNPGKSLYLYCLQLEAFRPWPVSCCRFFFPSPLCPKVIEKKLCVPASPWWQLMFSLYRRQGTNWMNWLHISATDWMIEDNADSSSPPPPLAEFILYFLMGFPNPKSNSTDSGQRAKIKAIEHRNGWIAPAIISAIILLPPISLPAILLPQLVYTSTKAIPSHWMRINSDKYSGQLPPGHTCVDSPAQVPLWYNIQWL